MLNIINLLKWLLEGMFTARKNIHQQIHLQYHEITTKILSKIRLKLK